MKEKEEKLFTVIMIRISVVCYEHTHKNLLFTAHTQYVCLYMDGVSVAAAETSESL